MAGGGRVGLAQKVRRRRAGRESEVIEESGRHRSVFSMRRTSFVTRQAREGVSVWGGPEPPKNGAEKAGVLLGPSRVESVGPEVARAPADTSPVFTGVPCVFSREGGLMCVVERGRGAGVYRRGGQGEGEEWKELVCVEGGKGATATAFSPRGSFLLTYEKPGKKGEGSARGNVAAWQVSSVAHEEVLTFHSSRDPVSDPSGWPALGWTSSEKWAVRMVANEVHVLRGDAQGLSQGVAGKLRVPGCSACSVSPGTTDDGRELVAIYVPEKRGAPASASLYDVAEIVRNSEAEPLARKSFFKCKDIQFRWSPTGESCLVLTETDVDASNKSYYGETNVYFLSGGNSSGEASAQVPLQKDGPVHDVGWNPSGKEFVVVHGFTPSKSILYDARTLQPRFDFGSAARNTVRWQPQGRFLLLGGFGNMGGEVEFWDRNKLKPTGPVVRAPGTVSCSWSPCGRWALTATLSPRLRVDNGFKIWRYDGVCFQDEALEELLQVEWEPVVPGMYPDRPQSPEEDRKRAVEGNAVARAASAAHSAPSKPVGAYVPPSRRGTGEVVAARKTLNEVTEGVGQAGRIRYASSKNASNVVGADFVESNDAEKKRKKKEAEKRRKEAKKAEGSAPTVPAPAPVVDVPKVPSEMSADELGKELKKLTKKLKQIEVLKEKQSKGEALEATQAEKVQGEAKVKAELAQVQALLGQ